MTSDKILVTLSTFAEYDAAPLRMLEQSGVLFDLNHTGKRISTPELWRCGCDATVVIAGVEPYDAPTLERLAALRCISRCGAGTDNVDVTVARRRGITVLNTPEVPAQAVAELALTMMLDLLRNLWKQTTSMRRHEWVRGQAHLLSGRRVGLVGLGRIGRRVATLLAPFGVQIFATDLRADSDWAEAHGVTLVPLGDLLKSCDIVSLHASGAAPLVIGAAEIGSMKPGSLLINVARGAMVDEAALYDALASGRLAGAGLDVYPEEPYRGRLCDLENTVLTPHTATLTVETRVAMETECVDKALRFLQGRLLPGERVA